MLHHTEARHRQLRREVAQALAVAVPQLIEELTTAAISERAEDGGLFGPLALHRIRCCFGGHGEDYR